LGLLGFGLDFGLDLERIASEKEMDGEMEFELGFGLALGFGLDFGLDLERIASEKEMDGALEFGLGFDLERPDLVRRFPSGDWEPEFGLGFGLDFVLGFELGFEPWGLCRDWTGPEQKHHVHSPDLDLDPKRIASEKGMHSVPSSEGCPFEPVRPSLDWD